VVSSSGVARRVPGRLEGEQPSLREEGFGPAHMVSVAPAEAGSFFLLAQDRAQPSSHEAVDVREDVAMRVLEVAEPAAQARVQVAHDARQAVAARARGPLPNAV